MASGAAKSTAFLLSIINLFFYFVVTVVAAWAINHGIEKTHETASVLQLPARIFPIYFPMGNMATGCLIIFSIIAGIVGMTTSATGVLNITAEISAPQLYSAAASSLITLLLSIIATGFACKEIKLGWTNSNLRTLETITIIVTMTQLFYTVAIHAAVEEFRKEQQRYW